MREKNLIQLYKFLTNNGFDSKIFINNCFDLIAKKNNTTLIIKVLTNIDSLRPNQANELIKLSDLFNATPLIIGEKTKIFKLKNTIVYERFGINTLTLTTLQNLIKEQFPITKSFKGKEIVELDYVKLRNARKKLNLSYREIAEKTNTSIETIYRYEHGANATKTTAKKIEEILNEKIIKEINVLKKTKTNNHFNENTNDETLEKITKLGIKLSLFSHAPFKAVTKNKILIQKGKQKKEIIKKAIELNKTNILSNNSLILTKKIKTKTIYTIPLIEEQELDTLNKKKDLIELIKERKTQ